MGVGHCCNPFSGPHINKIKQIAKGGQKNNRRQKCLENGQKIGQGV